MAEIVPYLLELVVRHGSFRVAAVDLAADAHRLVALPAEKLVFGLAVVPAEAEVDNRLLS